MARLESSIERGATLAAEMRLGIMSTKLAPVGSTGWPDRIFWVPGGKALYVELKRPREAPTKKQEYIHKLLKQLGYDVLVLDNVESVISALQERLCRKR